MISDSITDAISDVSEFPIRYYTYTTHLLVVWGRGRQKEEIGDDEIDDDEAVWHDDLNAQPFTVLMDTALQHEH